MRPARPLPPHRRALFAKVCGGPKGWDRENQMWGEPGLLKHPSRPVAGGRIAAFTDSEQFDDVTRSLRPASICFWRNSTRVMPSLVEHSSERDPRVKKRGVKECTPSGPAQIRRMSALGSASAYPSSVAFSQTLTQILIPFESIFIPGLKLWSLPLTNSHAFLSDCESPAKRVSHWPEIGIAAATAAFVITAARPTRAAAHSKSSGPCSAQ